MSPYQRTLQMYCPFIAEEPSQNGEGCSFRVRGHRLYQIPCVLRGFSPVGCTSTARVHRYSVTPVACGRDMRSASLPGFFLSVISLQTPFIWGLTLGWYILRPLA